MVSNISCCVGYKESMVPPVGEVFQLKERTIMTIVLFRCFALGLRGAIPRAIINKSACSQLSFTVQHFFLDTCNKPIKRKV